MKTKHIFRRAITSPKNKAELRLIWDEAYKNDPNSYTLAQEIIICLGSLVRTDPNLFIEMLRLRVGLIIQASGFDQKWVNFIFRSWQANWQEYAACPGRKLYDTFYVSARLS